MTFKFYHYASNKINFNKGPLLGTALTITDTHLPGMQDIENPSIIIDSSGANAAAGYNYLYIQDWARYYFIVKRTWLADGALLINCQEDYIYTAKSLIEAQTGYCRYSGLGNGNINDGRVLYQPQTKKEEFAIEYENTGTSPIQYWYVIKFKSSWPYPTATPTVYDNWAINVAYLNQSAFVKFINGYVAKTENERVLIGSCILSINRINYVRMDSAALANYADNGIKFKSPFGEVNVIESTITWTVDTDEKCYILTGPECVQDIFSRNAYVANPRTDPDTPGTIHKFNTDGRFYKLNAQYVLKLPELQPITFVPSQYGLTTEFPIRFSICYEPYGENYVIKFRDASGNDAQYEPIVQQCIISVPFLTDSRVDSRAWSMWSNIYSLITGIGGSVTAALAPPFTGIFGIGSAISGYNVREEQQKTAEGLAMSLTPSAGGSIDWVYGGLYSPGNAKMYVLTKEPVMLPWGHLGIPDGEWRTILSLAGTGYAEIELVDISGNGSTYNYTDNELTQIKTMLSQGVIFNATP